MSKALVEGILQAIMVALAVAVLIQTVPILTWVERRGSAFIQQRLGPNRASIFGITLFGLIQPLADGIKFLWKEELVPEKADKVLFVLAPAFSLVPALMAFAVVPFGPEAQLGPYTVRFQAVNLGIGVLALLAFSGLAVYGVMTAGWASNNKYSLLGSLRGSAQMISYELAMGLSIVSVVLMAGTLDPMKIVESQTRFWFALPGAISFLVFTVCAFAETNRLPFDLPEGESELVAGYHVEYSGMRFSMFFMAEYIHMITASAMISSLFLGGWNGFLPFDTTPLLGMDLRWLGLDRLLGLDPLRNLGVLLPLAAFGLKVAFFLWLFVWIRWTLPRFRYDQLMYLGWKVLLPVAIANLFAIAFLIAYVPGWFKG